MSTNGIDDMCLALSPTFILVRIFIYYRDREKEYVYIPTCIRTINIQTEFEITKQTTTKMYTLIYLYRVSSLLSVCKISHIFLHSYLRVDKKEKKTVSISSFVFANKKTQFFICGLYALGKFAIYI